MPIQGCWHHDVMEITPSSIIEELADSIMFGDLANERPSVRVERLAPDTLSVDYGSPSTVYVIRVSEEPRT